MLRRRCCGGRLLSWLTRWPIAYESKEPREWTYYSCTGARQQQLAHCPIRPGLCLTAEAAGGAGAAQLRGTSAAGSPSRQVKSRRKIAGGTERAARRASGTRKHAEGTCDLRESGACAPCAQPCGTSIPRRLSIHVNNNIAT